MKTFSLYCYLSIAACLNAQDELQIERNTAELQRLFWFIQVTDIHISKFSGFKRAPDLKTFCESHVSIIKPDFVIVSGDLTDAKLPDKRRSRQFIEEWKLYQRTVNDCKAAYDTKWFDIKGNHDVFDVPGEYDKRNLFRQFSQQGWTNPSSYSYTHTKPFGNYTIVAMDASPVPGPRRPFNFFGVIDQERRHVLEQFSKESISSNLTIWFGHYTTSLVVDRVKNNVLDIMRNASYYLCGHLHTLAGLLNRMYSKHSTGMIELELGDWRDNRLYRVVAVDNDILSFTDVQFKDWPVILITNPKDALFSSPKEPNHRVKQSSHIRILIFSPGVDFTVEVSVDGEYLGKAFCVKGPLYALKWNPKNYLRGLHSITVTVKESGNLVKTVDQKFSLDGTSLSFPLLSNIVLRFNIHSLFQCIFWIIVIVYVVFLFLLRGFQNIRTVTSMLIQGNNFLTRNLSNFINVWVLRVWLVTKIRALYLLFICFILYLGIGPWFVADILDNETGVVFIWGIYVRGSYVPGSLAYLYGIFHIVTFNIPMLLLAGYIIHYLRTTSQKHHISRFHKFRHIYMPFFFLVAFHTYIAFIEFPTAYGTKAMVLGPVRTGSIVLAFVVYYLAHKYALCIPAMHVVDSNSS